MPEQAVPIPRLNGLVPQYRDEIIPCIRFTVIPGEVNQETRKVFPMRRVPL
jgi:hypothetical protein